MWLTSTRSVFLISKYPLGNCLRIRIQFMIYLIYIRNTKLAFLRISLIWCLSLVNIRSANTFHLSLCFSEAVLFIYFICFSKNYLIKIHILIIAYICIIARIEEIDLLFEIIWLGYLLSNYFLPVFEILCEKKKLRINMSQYLPCNVFLWNWFDKFKLEFIFGINAKSQFYFLRKIIIFKLFSI